MASSSCDLRGSYPADPDDLDQVITLCLQPRSLSLSLYTLALLLSHQSLLSDFQVCYVLHAAPAAPPRLPGRPSRPGAADPTHANTLPPCLPDEPPLCGLWRFLAFHIVWGRLERLIQVRCISLFSLMVHVLR